MNSPEPTITIGSTGTPVAAATSKAPALKRRIPRPRARVPSGKKATDVPARIARIGSSSTDVASREPIARSSRRKIAPLAQTARPTSGTSQRPYFATCRRGRGEKAMTQQVSIPEAWFETTTKGPPRGTCPRTRG